MKIRKYSSLGCYLLFSVLTPHDCVCTHGICECYVCMYVCTYNVEGFSEYKQCVIGAGKVHMYMPNIYIHT